MYMRSKNKFMKTTLPIIMIFMFTAGISAAQARSKLPVKIHVTAKKIKAKLSAPTLIKLKSIKRKIIPEIINRTPTTDIFGLGKKHVLQSGINQKGLDIDEIIHLVMVDLWHMNDEDLSDMLSEMENMNEVKKNLRDYINSMKAQKTKALKELNREYNEMKSRGTLKNEPGVSAPFSVFTIKKKRTDHFKIGYVILHKNGKTIDIKKMTPERLKMKKKEYESNLTVLNGLMKELSLKLRILRDRRANLIQTLNNIMKRISPQNSIVDNIK